MELKKPEGNGIACVCRCLIVTYPSNTISAFIPSLIPPGVEKNGQLEGVGGGRHGG